MKCTKRLQRLKTLFKCKIVCCSIATTANPFTVKPVKFCSELLLNGIVLFSKTENKGFLLGFSRRNRNENRAHIEKAPYCCMENT